ncbi:MAG: hypothetical protein AB7I27_16220 [Bacteriovoracaceae bacterium]
MRIPIILLLFISMNVLATDDKTVNDLFAKYDKVMNQNKIELIDEVFTKKFLTENGGKEEFISKVKSIPPKKSAPFKITWEKGHKTKNIYAKIIPQEKGKISNSKFILKDEDGKLKIDGTVGDVD